MQKWIKAARLRTLPLSLASILMGSFLAVFFGSFSWGIFALTLATTVSLQVLSNFANDYGDSQNGADHAGRLGPARAVQTGEITAAQMLRAVKVFAVISLLSGLALLVVSFGSWQSSSFWAFLALGFLAIFAAYTYTAGSKPYGYAGLGDLSVFLFFGPVAVLGTLFLQHKSIPVFAVLLAVTSGFFAVNVLNINNLRDIDSDRVASKNTIPVRFGKPTGVLYHQALLLLGWLAAGLFAYKYFVHWQQYIFVLLLPFFAFIAKNISKHSSPSVIDTFLKKMSLASLAFSLVYGLSLCKIFA
jgi:1,4-dihydroxy-2-naphthoate polyprenyltransferase